MIKAAKKYIIAINKEKTEEVSRVFEDMGCFEIREDKINESVLDNEKDIDFKLSSLDFAITYLTSYAKKTKKGFLFKKEDRTSFLSEKESKLLKEVKRVAKIERNFDLLKRENKELHEKQKKIDVFGDLTFVPQETKYTFSEVVSLPKKTEAFVGLNVFTKLLRETSSKDYFLLIGELEEKDKIIEELKNVKGEVISYDFPHPAKREKKEMEERLKQIEREEKALKQELTNIAKNIEDFRILRDLIEMQKTEVSVKKNVLDSSILNYITFWGYEKDVKTMEKRLKDGVMITEATIKEDEQPPVVFKNNKFIRPFEYVTEIFGLPREDEIDPTPFHALFFILFFGICITDAGYGILLAIFTLFPIILLKGKMEDDRLVKLMFYGGISTFFAGSVFGSYFGLDVSVFQNIPVINKLAYLKRIDPIKDTLVFMGLAFSLGFIQIFFSQIVRIIVYLRTKAISGIVNAGLWAAFYVALLFFVLSGTVIPSIAGVVKIVTIVLAGALIVSEAWGQKIVLIPLVGAIKFIQGVIGGVSDILSYSRLMALGLATAIIALIVNQIAALIAGMIPYVGWVFGALILVGGHLFNLAINALGGFIHSGRLQFVEFFPKFLQGGGKRFIPTKSDLKFIKIK